MIQCSTCGAANFDNSQQCQQCQRPMSPAGGYGAPQGGGIPPTSVGFPAMAPQPGGFGPSQPQGGYGPPSQPQGGYGAPGGYVAPQQQPPQAQPQGGYGAYGAQPSAGFGPPPGAGFALPLGLGGTGRVSFAGTGGELFLLYLLAAVLPLVGVFVVAGGVPAALMSVADGHDWGLFASLPFFVLGLVGYIAVMGYFGNKLLKFYWDGVTLEGKRCQYNGTVADLLKSMALPYLLVLVTFGLYAPWFTARFHQWMYSRVDVSGERMEFHGAPGELFGTFILGIVLMLVGGMIPLVGIVAQFCAQMWLLGKMAEWRWRSTSASGRPMGFNLDVNDLLGTMAVPGVLLFCTLGIYTPWFICRFWDWEARQVQ